MPWGDTLFAWRGVAFGALAALVVSASHADPRSACIAAPLLGAGLGLRAWAFAHLGPQGRTRSSGPPAARVVSGPYAYARHPVYLGNLGVALSLVVAAGPGAVTGLSLLVAVVLYGLLATRETAATAQLEPRSGTVLAGRALIRSERATWASLSAVVLATLVVGALR